MSERQEPAELHTGFLPRGRAMRVIGPAMGVIWLVFLLQPLQAALAAVHSPYRWLSAAAVVGQAALFATISLVSGPARRSDRLLHGAAWLLIGAQILCVALTTLAAREVGLIGLVFVTVTAIMLLPLRAAVVVGVAAVAAVHVVPRLAPGWETVDDLTLSIVLAAVAVFAFRQLIMSNRALLASRDEVAALAVDRERERIARDMHDVLGHSLTVVAVKAELAARLVDVDPARARVEIAEVQALARAALTDVRAMVTATREVTLPGELAGARHALDAAGIQADVPGTSDEVPDRLRLLFAWTVREGTTNVLRHADARRVRIAMTADTLVVDDDGNGVPRVWSAAHDDTAPDTSPRRDATCSGATDDGTAREAAGPDGHGLAGLAERARDAGAVLATGRSPWGGFRLEVRG